MNHRYEEWKPVYNWERKLYPNAERLHRASKQSGCPTPPRALNKKSGFRHVYDLLASGRADRAQLLAWYAPNYDLVKAEWLVEAFDDEPLPKVSQEG